MTTADVRKGDGLLTDEQLQQAMAAQRESGQSLPEVIVNLGFCAQEQVHSAISEHAGVPLVQIHEGDLNPQVISLIPAELAYRHQALPLSADDSSIRVAIADPFSVAAADDIRMVTGLAVEIAYADPQEIRRLVEEHYVRRMMADTTEDEVQILEESEEEIGDLARMAREATVIKFVNLILRQAVQERATDVHVEPFEKGMRVRYRIDGVLHEISSPPRRLQAAIISRLKIMANLDIAERRLPQDGRIKSKIAGREIDIRVSTVPTLYGESVALRLLDRSAMSYTMETIGMLPDALKKMDRLIVLPHGMILATGPTGSGKTTTLYAALRKAYSPAKNVITIEDPIEYQLDGINQIQVHPKIGLSFANGLRHILRQDPDIIMVGEIRDPETAEIAIHSALTGHLVFSTLHTNDAAGAVTRLLEMGIEPYLVASSVEAVLAQRLVRLICPKCKALAEHADEIIARFSENGVKMQRTPKLYRGCGCDQCKQTGYRGRTGIYELFLMDDRIRSLVLERAPAGAIRDVACEHGMRTLRQDGWNKVLDGITTAEEVVRVTQQDEVESVE
ncbi:MAG TPA: type II secretion system ATPase GspE [Armatimonadota bacterium]|nr:type II secretion system ATPase GspE [Armatimonadota bacterium]